MLVILEAIAGQSEPTLARHERARSLARCQNRFGRSGAAISSGSRELASAHNRGLQILVFFARLGALHRRYVRV